MKRQAMKLVLHALYFGIALLIGIYQIFMYGFSTLATNTAKGDMITFVFIYLALVAIEAIVENRVFNPKPIGKAILSAALALAAGLGAFVLFLFIGVALGEITPNRILSGLAAIVLFLILEWPIRWALEKATRRYIE